MRDLEDKINDIIYIKDELVPQDPKKLVFYKYPYE